MELQTGCPVDLSLSDRRLILKPVPGGRSLKELLARVTEDNLHGELLLDRPAGREVW
jgi:antitoxin component of MazEF toxin-antitoxin module